MRTIFEHEQKSNFLAAEQENVGKEKNVLIVELKSEIPLNSSVYIV